MDFSGQQTGSDWVRASSFGPFYFYEDIFRPFFYYNMIFFFFLMIPRHGEIVPNMNLNEKYLTQD